MSNPACRYCGSVNLLARKVEIRRVNIINMLVASSQFVTELECRDCGWMGTEEAGLAVSGSRALKAAYG